MPLAFIGLVAFSWYNAQVPVIHEYRVKLDKPLSKPLKVLVASDLHLDYLVGNRAIQKLVEVNKKVQPDIILMPGDIINNDASVYYKYNMQEDMKKLTAPLGVYASLGNHEFYGLLAENIQAIKDGNIILLRDQAIVINNEFILVGREDQTNPERLPLEQILAKQNPNLPILVMDHRPYFDEVIASKVDLQVSGHTHRGQLFPLNLVVSFMYDLSYGYKQVEASHLFTTSGWGFWGAPFRLGSQREVFVITLEGSN
ncbi:metallophosphoesterase [Psittacicella hinzii]|nr:metallophosphoesterase [Psittacicella hinzii]